MTKYTNRLPGPDLGCISLCCPACAQTYFIFTMAGNGRRVTRATTAWRSTRNWRCREGSRSIDGEHVYRRWGEQRGPQGFGQSRITTFAGNKPPGTRAKRNGDPATLIIPPVWRSTAAGNVYIADSQQGDPYGQSVGNHYHVRRHNVAGFQGDGSREPGQLNFPTAVAVDSKGNVYICDSNNNAIREVVSGTINTIREHPGVSVELRKGWSVDFAGNIFVADTGNERMVEFTAGLYNFFVSRARACPDSAETAVRR